MTAEPRVVTAVVCAAFDDGGDAAIRERIARLAGAGLPVRVPPRHRPHLTLAGVRTSTLALPEVLASVREVAQKVRPLPVVLDHVGSFPGNGVLWLGPAPQPLLNELHATMDGALFAAGWPRAFGERSAPGRWMPHCTLATRLPPAMLGLAVDVLSRRFRAVPTSVPALATILVGGQGDEDLVPLTGVTD